MVETEHRDTFGCVKRNVIKTQISPPYYTLTQTYPPCYGQISPFPPPFSAVSYFLFVLSTVKKKDNCKIYAFHYNVKRRKVLLRKISMHVFSVCYMYLYGFLSYYLCYTCSLPPPPSMVLYMYCLCFIFIMSMLYLYYLPSLHC